MGSVFNLSECGTISLVTRNDTVFYVLFANENLKAADIKSMVRSILNSREAGSNQDHADAPIDVSKASDLVSTIVEFVTLLEDEKKSGEEGAFERAVSNMDEPSKKWMFGTELVAVVSESLYQVFGMSKSKSEELDRKSLTDEESNCFYVSNSPPTLDDIDRMLQDDPSQFDHLDVPLSTQGTQAASSNGRSMPHHIFHPPVDSQENQVHEGDYSSITENSDRVDDVQYEEDEVQYEEETQEDYSQTQESPEKQVYKTPTGGRSIISQVSTQGRRSVTKNQEPETRRQEPESSTKRHTPMRGNETPTSSRRSSSKK